MLQSPFPGRRQNRNFFSKQFKASYPVPVHKTLPLKKGLSAVSKCVLPCTFPQKQIDIFKIYLFVSKAKPHSFVSTNITPAILFLTIDI